MLISLAAVLLVTSYIKMRGITLKGERERERDSNVHLSGNITIDDVIIKVNNAFL